MTLDSISMEGTQRCDYTNGVQIGYVPPEGVRIMVVIQESHVYGMIHTWTIYGVPGNHTLTLPNWYAMPVPVQK